MFNPKFSITSKIAQALIRIESLRHDIQNLPITPTVLATLRETARYDSVHYSTAIEGNRLTQEEVIEVIKHKRAIIGRERDQYEVLGYYKVLEYIEKMVSNQTSFSENLIQTIHALVMGGGKEKVKPTSYRDAQNTIRDGATGRLVYLPPEAKDVPDFMKEFVDWVNQTAHDLPSPIRASIVHYQFATIHPYFDGNGRTARLLVNFILHSEGYGLKGLYSLEEYYKRNLSDYYRAISIGPSHNYYMGRAEADITPWIEYFCLGMLDSFEHVRVRALQAQQRGEKDASVMLNSLNPRQRIVLTLFKKRKNISSKDLLILFTISERTARDLCQQWVEDGFLIVDNPSKKARTYALAQKFQELTQ